MQLANQVLDFIACSLAYKGNLKQIKIILASN